jgi:hypothetical protein
MTTPTDAADPRSEVPPAEARNAHRIARQQAAIRRRHRRRWLVALLVLIVVLSPALYSYTTTMLQTSSLPLGVRSVEWVRTHHGTWLVDELEHIYYGWWKAPKKGGPQLKTLPTVGIARARSVVQARHRAAPWPPPVRPVFPHSLPGEGIWRATGPPVDGGAPVLVTTFRTERDYPRIVAYVAWFDHKRTAFAYYPGRYEPPSAAVRGPMMVPYDERWRLLATFNAGFTHSDGNNGSADNGATNEPLTDGNATLLGYKDGRVAIVKWNGGPNVGPNVAWARQSLAPIVWNGRINPTLNTDPNSPQWGYTLGGVTRTWRTGVGIDRRGNLFYVVAEEQTVITLAKILQHVGAVRAMEFDINPEWHTLVTYTHRHGLAPTLVEPQPMQSATRYLFPDDRDFFAVYRRLPGPVTVPFK